MIKEEWVQYPEIQDYPRLTFSMVETLKGIRQFREELEQRRP
jgi:hypothetical protein